MRISDVLRGKTSGDVFTVSPTATVRELVALLGEHNIGALVVSTDGSTVQGIVSERDVVRQLHHDESVLDSPVESIMTTDVQTCEGPDDVPQLMHLMTQRRIRHLPVVADGRLVGLVSIGDMVKSRIDELEFERDQLDSYVHQT